MIKASPVAVRRRRTVGSPSVACLVTAWLLFSACSYGHETKLGTRPTASTVNSNPTRPAGGSEQVVTADVVTRHGGVPRVGVPSADTLPDGRVAVDVSHKAVEPAGPGNYVYDVSGSRTAGSQAVAAQPYKDVRSLEVSPGVDAYHQRWVERDTEGNTTDYLFWYTPDGQTISHLAIVNKAFGEEFASDPPVLAVPVERSTGESWTWLMSSVDGTEQLHGNFHYDGPDSQSVGGSAIAVDRFAISLEFTGAKPLSLKRTVWLDPASNLPVKIRDVVDGVRDGVSLHQDETATIRSVRPS